jgi:general secretion pathway protein A
MYTGFFGLNSQPFSIAPNPEFMYLGARHTEALAHLRYGLGDAGGFVLLTGEVGTGKTTVSRCLLADLPANTQVAFILNPTLSELELLGAICDELKIRYKKTDASLKLLTDKITAKLLKNHQAGINTILIIDEAQHLQPAVLEQLRLLTNLETNTKKLLQVILIGQPELQQLLQRQDLRQLAQRITARYHLMPLTLAEVQYYVQHRLQVAGCNRPVFTEAALKKLFQLSGGIPRLVNLICDRALLGGYSQQKALIDAPLVQQAAGEILAIRQPDAAPARPWWLVPLLAFVFLLCIGVGVLVTLLLHRSGV